MNTDLTFDATEWYAGYDQGFRAALAGDTIEQHTRFQYSTSEWMDGFLNGYEEAWQRGFDG